MGRRSCRKDNNHDVIVAAFRKLGYRVLDVHQQGGGLPDLLVAAHKLWHPVEIKNLKATYGRQGLSPAQRRVNEQMDDSFVIVTCLDDVIALAAAWRRAAPPETLGQPPDVHRVRTPEEALRAIGEPEKATSKPLKKRPLTGVPG